MHVEIKNDGSWNKDSFYKDPEKEQVPSGPSNLTSSFSKPDKSWRKVRIIANHELATHLKEKITPQENNSFGQTPLHQAAKLGQEREVIHLLLNKAAINARDSSGKTALFLAAERGRLPIVKLLIQQEADCTIRNNEEETLLHAAAFFGHVLLLDDLLKNPLAKPLIHARDKDQKIPLHCAVYREPKPEVVKLLLEKGSDPNSQNAVGYTPLHLACRNGHVKSVNYLKKKGARFDMANSRHELPLDLAIYSNQDEVLHRLLKTSKRLPIEKRLEDHEGHLFNCLIQAQKNKLIEEQIVYLLKLGDFYVRKNDILKGVKLINGALSLLQKHKKNPVIEHYLLARLNQIEVQFFKSKELNAPVNLDIEYRLRLNRIRDYVWKAYENDNDIQHTLSELTKEYAKLLAILISEAQTLLGPPPVIWACIGLGSMSRGEMCSYSDVEFAFLLEKNSEKALQYFRNLSEILELRIINLGETRFPIFSRVDPLHPSPTPGGFSLDTGGNTPLGVPGVYELIGTPMQLAQFEGIQWMDRNIILTNAMSNVCWVAGDKNLVDQYNQEKTAILDQNLQMQGKTTNRDELGFRLLEGHLEEFRPNLSKDKEEIKAFGIKKELYRPFQETLGCLALIYNLKATTTLLRIDELQQQGVFSLTGAENLKKAIQNVMALRFEAHSFYQDEQEYLCHRENGKEPDPSLLYMNEKHVKALHAIYRVLLPFHKCMQEFALTKDKKILVDNDFYEEGPAVQGKIFEKTLQYRLAHEAYQKAVTLNPNDVEALLLLGEMDNTLGNSQEALKRAEQALKLVIENYGTQHPDVGKSYNNIGEAYRFLGNYQEALNSHKKAYDIFFAIYGDEEHLDVAKSFNNIGVAYEYLGQYEEALSYKKKAFRIRLKLLGEEHLDVAKSYNAIGSVYQSLDLYQKSLKYYHKAVKILNKFCSEDHPDVAKCYNNIGVAHDSLGNFQEAIGYHEKALNIRIRIFGEGHPEVAQSYNNLGTAYDSIIDNNSQQFKSNKDKSLIYHNNALKIRLKIYGENHPDVAYSYNNIGVVYSSLGSFKETLENFEKALNIRLEVHGRTHPDVAKSYNNIGGVFCAQGKAQEALDAYQKAIEILISTFGEQHPRVAKCNINIGLAYQFLDRSQDALESFQKVLQLKISDQENHNETTKRKIKSILTFADKALDTWLKFYDKDHPFVATCYKNIALVYESLGLDFNNHVKRKEHA